MPRLAVFGKVLIVSNLITPCLFVAVFHVDTHDDCHAEASASSVLQTGVHGRSALAQVSEVAANQRSNKVLTHVAQDVGAGAKNAQKLSRIAVLSTVMTYDTEQIFHKDGDESWSFFSTKDSDTIQLVTQCSLDRLSRLKKLADLWDGAISAAVFIGGADEVKKVMELAEHWAGRQAPSSLAVLHAPNHTSDLDTYSLAYPVNALRNLAMRYATSKYVFVLDVDFVPSRGLAATLEEQLPLDPGVCLVVPALQSHKLHQAPRSMEEVRSEYQRHVFPFDIKGSPTGHNATDYKRFLSATTPYEVEYQYKYEPYFVVRRNSSKFPLPAYDERFHGYGKNKIAQVYEMALLGAHFVVAAGGFVIHTDMDRWSDRQRKNTHHAQEEKELMAISNQVWQQFQLDVGTRLLDQGHDLPRWLLSNPAAVDALPSEFRSRIILLEQRIDFEKHVQECGNSSSAEKAIRRIGMEKQGSGKYAKGRSHYAYYRHLVCVLQYISPAAQSILDVGSSFPPFLASLPEVPTRDAVALYFPGGDKSVEKALAGCKQGANVSIEKSELLAKQDGPCLLAPGVHGFAADFMKWEPNTTYDVVLCSQVLEHVDDPSAFLQKLLKTGKHIVVSVPYLWDDATWTGVHHKSHMIDLGDVRGWAGKKELQHFISEERHGRHDGWKQRRAILIFQGLAS